MPKKEMDTFTKVVLIIVIFTLIAVCVGMFYYTKNNTTYTIDSSDGIDSPHLSGETTIEVDYMDHCEITQEELDEISVLFAKYGVNITFILDDEVSYQSELSIDEIAIYYEEYRDLNVSSYILIGSTYSEESNVLGCIFNAEKIIIFKDKIDKSFDDCYEHIALQYVIMHEVAHAYGCMHSDDKKDIMYPYLSQAKIMLYPEPQFFDDEVISELLD